MEIYEKKTEELLKLCESLEDFDGYELNKELFNEFYKNGNRLNYENEYFLRRKCLTARAVKAIVIDNGKGDIKLNEIINAVCDEFTWTLPAHLNRDTKKPETIIDLFSAETAQTLSEILRYIDVPEKTSDRIRKLLFERIINPYENNIFHWETAVHNWSAVCAGCVGMVYMLVFPERFPYVKGRMLKSMDSFLSGYGNDGACLEGLGYWSYGFGYFVYFAEMLRSFDGTDLFLNEKVKRIAEFGQDMFLQNGRCVSFSDSPRNGSFNIGLLCFLKNKFGDKIQVPDIKYRMDLDNCFRFAPYLRSFLWLDKGTVNGNKNICGYKYFDDAQWYINKREKFAFAAKGGHNDEPHNHNDIGSFIIVSGDEQLIMDFGAGEYTRDYFDEEKRYDNFCASSGGHSVPIINGEYQKSGRKHRAKFIKSDANCFAIDISKAYDVKKLDSLVRKFKISENEILMCDMFGLDGDIKTERLVSPIRPVVKNGDIKIKNMTISSDILSEINEVKVINHEGKEETVYTIDYELSSNVFECRFTF